MKHLNKFIAALLLLWAAVPAQAQEELFGSSAAEKRHSGFILNGNASADIPLMDMAKRFGADYRVGASLTYKTNKNWIFGVKYDFLLGNNTKEDSLAYNIRDKYSGSFNGKVFQVLNVNGERIGVPVYERGFLWGLQIGKIIPLKKGQKDNGLMLLTSGGMMQHRINIFARDGDVAQIQGDYMKGYDRLTQGFFVEQFVGYVYFSKNRFVNFNIGLDLAWGFTQGKRAYLFDVGHADLDKRNDVLFGLRGAWMIPIFRPKSEDISFE